MIPYSAMVPGHIAGDYTWDEITIDLVRLCQSAGVRFVSERVTALDPTGRQVCFAGRPSLVYDALSLGLGSIPARPPHAAAGENSLLMRPLATLCHKINSLATELQAKPRPFHLVVVGGGASGCELALAIHKRLGHRVGFHLTLLQENARLVPQFPAKAARLFRSASSQDPRHHRSDRHPRHRRRSRLSAARRQRARDHGRSSLGDQSSASDGIACPRSETRRQRLH